MSDTPPDRLAIDPRSKYHDAQMLERGVGIRFNGRERSDVEEYCISEGWIRTAFGKSLDRRGRPMTVRSNGTVEAYFLDGPESGQAEDAAAGKLSSAGSGPG